MQILTTTGISCFPTMIDAVKVTLLALLMLTIDFSTSFKLCPNCDDQLATFGNFSSLTTFYVADRPPSGKSAVVPFRITIPDKVITFVLLVSGNMSDSRGQLLSRDGKLFENPVLLNRSSTNEFGNILHRENGSEYSGSVFFNNTDSPSGCLFMGHINESTGHLSWKLTAGVLASEHNDNIQSIDDRQCERLSKLEQLISECVLKHSIDSDVNVNVGLLKEDPCSLYQHSCVNAELGNLNVQRFNKGQNDLSSPINSKRCWVITPHDRILEKSPRRSSTVINERDSEFSESIEHSNFNTNQDFGLFLNKSKQWCCSTSKICHDTALKLWKAYIFVKRCAERYNTENDGNSSIEFIYKRTTIQLKT